VGSFTTVWRTGIACPRVQTHRVLSGVRWQSAQPEQPRPCPPEQANHRLQVFEYLTGVAQVHLWSGIPFESPMKQLLHITTIATVRDLEWHEGVEGCAVWSPRVRCGNACPSLLPVAHSWLLLRDLFENQFTLIGSVADWLAALGTNGSSRDLNRGSLAPAGIRPRWCRFDDWG
jgi:hypothetical protein